MVTIALLAAAGVGLLRARVAAALAIQSSTGIDEHRYEVIGGIRQSIRIRGQDRRNPVILFLHGGPGGAVLSASYRPFLSWEREFTVVHWDQRGAGLTYAATGYDATSTNIDRLVRDGIEVAEYARRRLGTQQVVLVGHSWGSHLGALIAQRRPDLFSAFVATGLWVDFEASGARLYTAAVERAQKSGDARGLRQLESIANRPFDDLARWKAILQWSSHPSDPTFPSDVALFIGTLLSPEYSVTQAWSYRRGFVMSTELLGKEAMRSTLDPDTGFGMPIFLFQGDRDGHVDPGLAVSYSDTVDAPQKQVVLFPGGGHYLHVNDEARFLQELVDRVRPFAR